MSERASERASESVGVSEDISPYCSVHDEWLIMKLCMYVGYHAPNKVSNFGGDPIKLKKQMTIPA